MEQVRCAAEYEGLQQQTIDFDTWIQQRSIETHSRNIAGADNAAHSEISVRATEDDCERSKSLNDLDKSSANQLVYERLSPQRQLLNALKLQLVTCEEINEVIRAAIGTCDLVQRPSSTVTVNGQGDGCSNVKFTEDKNVEQLLIRLQESLMKNDKIQHMLKSSLGDMTSSLIEPTRSVGEWVHHQSNTAEPQNAEMVHEWLKSHNASLLQVLSLSQNQLVRYGILLL